ncbi:MAG: PAS domain-containing protein [Bacteroidetes bacterium]|nr:PAS domain-containing protein [Bacteroidota bacterium]
MNYDEMDRPALLEEIGRLQKKIEGLKESGGQLERQLQTRDIEIIKLKRELQDHLAEAICRENDMRRDQDRFRTLVSNIPGAVYRCANDAFWTMEYMSEQIEAVSGYPATDFINNAVRSYKSIVHPEDVIKVVNAVNDGVNARRPYYVEYRVKHRDGSIRHVHERGIGIHTEDGTLLWLDGVIFDQTVLPNHLENNLPEW